MKIMDVTFRESVLCQNQIELKSVYNTINKLAETNIDYIEIGYLKFGKSANPLENYSPEYISKCYEICAGKTKLAAMIHPDDFFYSKYNKDIVKKLSLIRVTCKPANIQKVSEISSYFRPLGVEVSVNLLRASKFSDEQSLEYCGKAKELGANFFYIADSNGHFLPYQVRSRIFSLKKGFPEMQIGFHPHDNLRLAAVNAIEAAQGGADIVDSSLLGYGKGAGNLKTEVFLLVLGRLTGKQNIENIYSLFRVAQYFCNNVVSPNTFEEEFKFSLYGLFDIDLDVDKKICEVSRAKEVENHELAFELIRQCKGDMSNLGGLLEEYGD
jgi:4-hydroxy 2-oxovalerate aldolase